MEDLEKYRRALLQDLFDSFAREEGQPPDVIRVMRNGTIEGTCQASWRMSSALSSWMVSFDEHWPGESGNLATEPEFSESFD